MKPAASPRTVLSNITALYIRCVATSGEASGAPHRVTFSQMISPENMPLEAPFPYAPLKIRPGGIG